jgi:hypothetical protein
LETNRNRDYTALQSMLRASAGEYAFLVGASLVSMLAQAWSTTSTSPIW